VLTPPTSRKSKLSYRPNRLRNGWFEKTQRSHKACSGRRLSRWNATGLPNHGRLRIAKTLTQKRFTKGRSTMLARAVAAVLLMACTLGAAPLSGRITIGGGRHLYLECHGSGSPTVVLDAGHRAEITLDDRNHWPGLLRFTSSLQSIWRPSKFRSFAIFENPLTWVECFQLNASQNCRFEGCRTSG